MERSVIRGKLSTWTNSPRITRRCAAVHPGYGIVRPRMSDNWLRFVPSDPAARPTEEAADRAVRLLRKFAPNSDRISAEFKEKIEFFDPGANWSGVKCPACGADAEPWLAEKMSVAFRTSFTQLELTTPCCGTRTSLNDLDYVWPAAFGSFVLEALNPNIGNTTAQQDSELSRCLGLPLRKVLRHL
jgi:hypothetical protein